MPDWGGEVRRRLGELSPDGGREAEIVEELAGHLEQCFEEAREAGRSEPEAARLALAELEDPRRLARQLRLARHPVAGRLMDGPPATGEREPRRRRLAGLGQDLRHGIRLLLWNPAFTLAALLTLGLGIGASTAVFSVVNGVLLRPLNYQRPEELALIRIDVEGQAGIASLSAPELVDLRREADRFTGFAGLWGTAGALTDGEPEHVRYAWATHDLFPLLGVEPILGRGFRAGEDDPGGEKVAILGEGLWRRRYGADPGIVGRLIEVDDTPRRVIGVMPRGLQLPRGATTITLEQYDLWIPQTYWENRDLHWLRVLARVQTGVSFAEAEQQLERLSRRLKREYNEYANTDFRLHAVPLKEAVIAGVRPTVLALAGAVAFVLLTACANVAGLLLARSRSRETEIAVRSALGAGPGRIVRQVLIEGLLVSLLAGGLGVLLARWGIGLLLAWQPAGLPRLQEIAVDGTALAVSLGVALLTGLLFGLAPVSQVGRLEIAAALRDGGRMAGGPAPGRLRATLVVTEVALSLVLLVGAGLMVRTFVNLQRVDPGFRGDGVLTFRVPISVRKHESGESRWAFYRALDRELAALPGVESGGAVSLLPLGGGLRTGPYAHDAATEAAWGQRNADYRTVVPGYLRTVGARLLEGRTFDGADAAARRRVVVVDETLAREGWPGESALGRRIKLQMNESGNELHEDWAEVIGVVAHIRQADLQSDGEPQIYRPFWLDNPTLMIGLVRAREDPMSLVEPVREAVRRLGAGRPVHRFRVLQGYVADQTSGARLTLSLMGLFAGTAVVLAAVGLYGVLAYSVSRRTREFGVRMALGARARDILRLVVGEGLLLAAVGIALGVAGALALTRFLGGMLFGVRPTDPLVFSALALLLGAVALVACLLPARRATRVDPMVTLRDA